MGLSSVQSIYKWEAGQCFPQADNLLALARFYHVSPFDLLSYFLALNVRKLSEIKTITYCCQDRSRYIYPGHYCNNMTS